MYTGYTDDVEGRVGTHLEGKGSKYTRSRLPVELVYSEKLGDKSSAMKREAEIKGLGRGEKERIVQSSKLKMQKGRT